MTPRQPPPPPRKIAERQGRVGGGGAASTLFFLNKVSQFPRHGVGVSSFLLDRDFSDKPNEEKRKEKNKKPKGLFETPNTPRGRVGEFKPPLDPKNILGCFF